MQSSTATSLSLSTLSFQSRTFDISCKKKRLLERHRQLFSQWLSSNEPAEKYLGYIVLRMKHSFYVYNCIQSCVPARINRSTAKSIVVEYFWEKSRKNHFVIKKYITLEALTDQRETETQNNSRLCGRLRSKKLFPRAKWVSVFFDFSPYMKGMWNCLAIQFTRALKFFIKPLFESIQQKYNPGDTIPLPRVFSVAWAFQTSTVTFIIGFFVGLATSHACP